MKVSVSLSSYLCIHMYIWREGVGRERERVRHTHVHIDICVYIHICIYIDARRHARISFVCICVFQSFVCIAAELLSLRCTF